MILALYFCKSFKPADIVNRIYRQDCECPEPNVCSGLAFCNRIPTDLQNEKYFSVKPLNTQTL